MTRKKATLRTIDSGTIYDVEGKMRHMVRRLERGEYGKVVDAVVILRTPMGPIEGFHFGTGHVAEVHYMLSTMKNRLEPA